MTLLEHLGELRKRLVRGFLAILIGFFACYGFASSCSIIFPCRC